MQILPIHQRIQAFLLEAGCARDASGMWHGSPLETCEVSPTHETVRDLRTGRKYRVLPVDAADPFLVPVERG